MSTERLRQTVVLLEPDGDDGGSITLVTYYHAASVLKVESMGGVVAVELTTEELAALRAALAAASELDESD